MTHIVGRAAELSTLEAFLAAIVYGFRCLVLEGDAGIGKTSLWRDGIDRARASGLTVLVCRPTKAEARLSFAALGDLLEGVSDHITASLPEPQRRALEVALLKRDASGSPPDRRAIAVGVLSVLRTVARASPLLVGIDDVQWLDGPTAAVLEFGVRRLADAPVGLLAAVRTGEQPARTFIGDIDEQRVRRIRVGPLETPAMHDLIKQKLGYGFSRPTLMRIADESRGNPLMALEIARVLPNAGDLRPGDTLPVPHDLHRIMADRVRRLPLRTREELLVAAALAMPTADLVDTSALEPAESAGIARLTPTGSIEFVHPLYASAIYGLASAETRRDLHGRLAEAVPDPEDRARHLALSAGGPDERIARALESGAARARSRGAWESAADLLEQARDLTPPELPDETRRRAVTAAEHHVHAGDRARGRRLLESVLAESLPDSLRARALRVLAEILASGESYPRAADLLVEALEYADAPETRVTVLLGLAYVHANMIEYDEAAERSEEALACASATEESGLIAEAMAYRVMMNYLRGRGVDWPMLWRAVEQEDPSRLISQVARPSTVAGCLLLYVGRLDEARERLMGLRGEAMAKGDESDLAFVDWWLVWLETLSGRYEAAAELATEAAHVAELTGAPSSRSWVLAMRGLLAAHRGDLDEARRDADDALRLAERSGWATSARWAVAARCLADLSAGEYSSVWAVAQPLADPIETYGIGEPVGFWFLPDALEALIASGELERAEQLLEPFERRGRELDRAWALATAARCRGLLHGARGELESARRAFMHALSEHHRVAMPFEHARTLLCLGQLQRRARQWKAARDTLQSAETIFDSLGARVWAERAQAEVARTHVRQTPSGLSPTEQRVAELAVSGATNRQIAEQLFMSPKTVEANLARAYRKLGIHSRAELGRHMAQQDQA